MCTEAAHPKHLETGRAKIVLRQQYWFLPMLHYKYFLFHFKHCPFLPLDPAQLRRMNTFPRQLPKVLLCFPPWEITSFPNIDIFIQIKGRGMEYCLKRIQLRGRNIKVVKSIAVFPSWGEKGAAQTQQWHPWGASAICWHRVLQQRLSRERLSANRQEGKMAIFEVPKPFSGINITCFGLIKNTEGIGRFMLGGT